MSPCFFLPPYLRALQVLPELVQVGDDLLPVGVGPVQSLLHLLKLVLEVLVLRLRALKLGAEAVDLALGLLNL